MARMTDCPEEVLNGIIGYVAVPSLTRESDLYSLALVSRRLYRAATRKLYRDVAFAFPEIQPLNHFDNQPRWLTYRRFLFFLRSLKETATLGLLVNTARIIVDDQSERLYDIDVVQLSMDLEPRRPEGETDFIQMFTNQKASTKAADIKAFLRMVPLVRNLHVDYENFYGLDRHILEGSSFTCLEVLTFRAPGASLDSASYLFWIPTLKILTLEGVTLGEHPLEVPEGQVKSSIETLRLGSVRIESGLPGILKWLPDLDSVQYFGKYAAIEELIDGLKPVHKSLKCLDLGVYNVQGNRVSLGDFSRLIYLTIPDSLLCPFVYIFSGQLPLLIIKAWPQRLRQLDIVYHYRQPFLHHPPNQLLEETPSAREIKAILELISLKFTQLPDLERIRIQHKRYDDFPREAWRPPPEVLDALSASGVVLENELPASMF